MNVAHVPPLPPSPPTGPARPHPRRRTRWSRWPPGTRSWGGGWCSACARRQVRGDGKKEAVRVAHTLLTRECECGCDTRHVREELPDWGRVGYPGSEWNTTRYNQHHRRPDLDGKHDYFQGKCVRIHQLLTNSEAQRPLVSNRQSIRPRCRLVWVALKSVNGWSN